MLQPITLPHPSAPLSTTATGSNASLRVTPWNLGSFLLMKPYSISTHQLVITQPLQDLNAHLGSNVALMSRSSKTIAPSSILREGSPGWGLARRGDDPHFSRGNTFLQTLLSPTSLSSLFHQIETKYLKDSALFSYLLHSTRDGVGTNAWCIFDESTKC